MNEIMKELLARLNEADEEGILCDDHESVCAQIYDLIGSTPRDVLKQILFHGPVWDGDIVSKSGRGVLFDCGLAVRCCFKGEQGFTAASYRAYPVWKHGYARAAEKLVSSFFEAKKGE